MENKEEKQEKIEKNTAIKQGIKNGALGFAKWVLDYVKSIIAVLSILFGITALRLIEREATYLPLGIVLILIGVMVAPRISKMTNKFETYKKYKIFIVIALVIIAVLLFMLAGYRMSN